MAKVKKGIKKVLNGVKWRVCECGARFKYNGTGRPFARCPKCRR